MLPDPGLYPIAAHRPFLEDLTAALLTGPDPASDPLTLSRMTVLLPTRRACRAMQDALLRLLPRPANAGTAYIFIEVDERYFQQSIL